MAFYLESQYLDLKKVYQNFSYESLETKIDILPLENITEGISQNSYTLVHEKDILYSDVNNLLIHFGKSYLNGSSDNIDKSFPFIKIKERICYIMQKYQEQSNLLDQHLEKIVSPFMNLIKQYLNEKLAIYLKEITENPGFKGNSIAYCDEFHHLLGIIYVICKVRGFRFVMKYFPHEVKDLEPAVFYLSSQRDNQTDLWETKYVMFLWLSIIILVPFDLSTIDSKVFSFLDQENSAHSQNLPSNLIQISQFYLKSITKIREAAGVFLASFFSRPDIQKLNLLEDFLLWAASMINNLQTDPLNAFFITGIFNSLVEIFKIGKRSELLHKIHHIMPFLKATIFGAKATESSVLRQAKVKLSQRIGLIYLKPRTMKWLYRLGNKHLIENLKKSQSSKLQVFNVESLAPAGNSSKGGDKKEILEKEDIDDPEYFQDVDTDNLEFIIDFLVQGLKDKDTIVRWSAAKGIGRITARLDHEMADDIVTSILSCFAPNENENSWHGGCLTLAELSRRGLLLPSRLDAIFPILSKALVFDQNQGNYSVGANVRDAACYVAWAFARAYSPEILSKYVSTLSQSLLITCLFDREVNCRRAASAAFQEHVGRQGNFPYGIEILTEADYFALGMRQNAFLNVGLFVGSYKEYYPSFVQHLAFVKLRHWDIEIRRLAASALALFSVLGGKELWNDVLRGLIKEALGEMVHIRHGALYGICDILCGLRGKSHLHNLKDVMKDSAFLRNLNKKQKKLIKAGKYMQNFRNFFEKKSLENQISLIEPEVIQEILEVLPKIEKARLFRGKGGEIMRIAACRLIEGLAIAEIKLSESLQKKYLEVLDDCLKNPLDLIQNAATKALKLFSGFYHQEKIPKDFEVYLQKIMRSSVEDMNVAVTRGYSRALGTLNSKIQLNHFEDIWRCLKKNCQIKPKDSDDPDTRKFASRSLKEMIGNIGLGNLKENILNEMFELCFELMNDYSTDKRGDIGSIIRETSMTIMLDLFILVVGFNEKFPEKTMKIPQEFTYKFVTLLLQQLVEKIDRVRLVAGSLLQEFFEKYANKLPEIPRAKELEVIFCKENVKEMLKKDEIRMEEIFETQTLASSAFEGPEYERDYEEFVYYWNQPHCVFPMIVPLMRFKEYSYQIVNNFFLIYLFYLFILVKRIGNKRWWNNRISYKIFFNCFERIFE